MKAYKDPSFQDRAGQAAGAKKKALEQLRAKPETDEATIASRRAASARRQAAKAEASAAKKATAEIAAQAKAEATARAAAPGPTEADRKAARDARYAARQKRR